MMKKGSTDTCTVNTYSIFFKKWFFAVSLRVLSLSVHTLLVQKGSSMVHQGFVIIKGP